MDIKYVRENPDLVKENQIKRFKDPEVVNKILELDTSWKNLRRECDNLNRLKNQLSKSFKSAPQEETIQWSLDIVLKQELDIALLTRPQLKRASKLVTETLVFSKEKEKELLDGRDTLVKKLGNKLYKDVLVDNNEDNNPIVVTHTEPTKLTYPSEPYDHVTLFEKLGFVDYDNGTRIAGNRGYFLKNQGVKLNRALMQYGLDFLENKGYQLMETPHFMTEDAIKQITQLSDYDETLYKLQSDKYLIATSEQPMTAYFADQTLHPTELPQKICGLSHCYRKETGAHARYTRGIYRVHQFQKLEQFVLCKPDDSWNQFNQLMEVCKEFYTSLGLSYRVVNIVSGALNDAASMKWDLEVYYPGSDKWCELVSCTNVLDYFSNRINTKSATGEYLHMLNCTLCANTRTLCALIETYQTEEGFSVPDVLKPYMKADHVDFFN